jgi:hypothetical protein
MPGMKSHEKASRAVLLDLGDGRYAAIAPHEMVEVLTEAPQSDTDDAAAPGREVVEWRGELLPVFDLTRWQAPDATQGGILAVVTYRSETSDSHEHGCLRLAAFPSLIPVSDDQACTLPDDSWRALAVACFRESDIAVPILKLDAVFAG